MPCKNKCCCKVKCEDKCGCKFEKFDCNSLLKCKNETRPTDPMFDYGAIVSSNGFRALIPYNHLTNHVSRLVSNTDPAGTILQDISVGILVSMRVIRLRRLAIVTSNAPTVPVTFRVYTVATGGRDGVTPFMITPTDIQVTLFPGNRVVAQDADHLVPILDLVLVLVEPSTIPQNLGYVTASIAYEELTF